MANPSRRGQSGSEVSSQIQSSNQTPWANTHFILPYGLRLQQKVGQANITNVTGNGTTVTYTANNNYSAGNIVSIYEINPVAYNLQNVTIASATSTQFTVTNSASGAYVSGGVAQRTGSIPVTIPTNITFVYAICVGGGGSGGGGAGGGGGGISWGWTLAMPSAIVGAGGVNTSATTGGYTQFGNVIAAGGGLGGGAGQNAAGIGAGGGGGGNINSGGSGGTNYWGVQGGLDSTDAFNNRANGGFGAGGGGGRGGDYSSISASVVSNPLGILVGIGGDGISGGGGGLANHFYLAGTLQIAGKGGSGLIGGGGGRAISTGLTTGGNGGNGFNILTGIATSGGISTTGTDVNSIYGAGGGGAGIVGNGGDASVATISGNQRAAAGNGGFGGGGGGGGFQHGFGGAGVLYLFY